MTNYITPEARKRYYSKIRKQEGEANLISPDHLLKQMELRSRQEVADMLNLSRQAIHQIERRAIYKIRRALKPHYDELIKNRAAQ